MGVDMRAFRDEVAIILHLFDSISFLGLLARVAAKPALLTEPRGLRKN
jgi:hypothetical protein